MTGSGVARSTIPGAGQGLFTRRALTKGADPILEYWGRPYRRYLNPAARPRRQREPLQEGYLMEVRPGGEGWGPLYVDASDPLESGLARYINSPWGVEGKRANARFVCMEGRVMVMLLRDVEEGEEILAWYTGSQGEEGGYFLV